MEEEALSWVLNGQELSQQILSPSVEEGLPSECMAQAKEQKQEGAWRDQGL